jgi:hemoglobin
MKIYPVICLLLLSTLSACAGKLYTNSPPPKDGELSLPAGYQQWPSFMASIEKLKGKQIRNIYINKKGKETKNGEAFPNGTQFVMELFKAQQDANGNLIKNNGKLVKGNLSKIFVMKKGTNWGKNIPKELNNGDWIYSAFNADGSKADVNYQACRGCHLPKSDKDYIFHYDQFFDRKK